MKALDDSSSSSCQNSIIEDVENPILRNEGDNDDPKLSSEVEKLR